MKNIAIAIIVVIIASFAFASEASAQVQVIPTSSVSDSSQLRVKLVFLGFDDPAQTELFVSKYWIQNAKWSVLVDNSPDLVYRVSCRTKVGPTQYIVDQKARDRNNTLRAIDQNINSAVWRSYSRSYWVYIAKQAGSTFAKAQLQSRFKPENFEVKTISSTVVVEGIDRRTSRIVSKGIGVSEITIKTLRTYGYEPFTVLSEGDLSSVISDPSANLGGNYINLIQLAAFVDATKPENQIIKQ